VSNRPLHIFIAGLAVFSVAPAANAQASTPTTPVLARPTAAPPAGMRPVSRTDFIRDLDASYKRLDANNDGSVAQAEIQAAQTRSGQAVDALLVKRRAEAFTRLDTNKDGQLSQAEFNAGTPLPQRPRADPAAALAKLDMNKDKKVTPAEFRGPPLANFDKLDLNRDGTISVDEQRKARTASK